MKGAPKTPVRFEAIWAEIDHPTQGKILYDTGYTWRFLDATQRFPQRIYAELTKVSILPEEEAHRQVDPAQVKHLICSHIHADHVGGLRDFPGATCWASEACLAQFDRLPNWRSWARGVLKSLFPDDWRETCQTFESTPEVTHDILGKIRLVRRARCPLPGHAAGQHGALLQTSEGPVSLVADAFWDIRAVTKGSSQPIVRVFFEDMKAYAQTLPCSRNFTRHTRHPWWPPLSASRETHHPTRMKLQIPTSWWKALPTFFELTPKGIKPACGVTFKPRS